MGALVPALPGLMAPAVAPLAVAHYHGIDQVLVEATMSLSVALAAVGIAVNLHEGRGVARPADKTMRDEPLRDEPLRDGGEAGAPRRDAPARLSNRPLRVLAAEDNAVNQLVLKALLAQVDVHPELVGDGKAALEAWAREPWDLILMDVQMPVMDGLAAARAIRAAEAQSGRARTPIVALSGAAMAHQAAAYAAAGIDAHLVKPLEAADLYSALRIATAPAAEAERNSAAA